MTGQRKVLGPALAAGMALTGAAHDPEQIGYDLMAMAILVGAAEQLAAEEHVDFQPQAWGTARQHQRSQARLLQQGP